MQKPEPGKGTRRLVKQIVVTYTLEGDPEQKEHTFGLRHTGEGAAVDALVWSSKLMKRLRYEDEKQPGRCVTPEQRSVGPEWRRIGTSGTMDTLANGDDRHHCYWIHDPDCFWFQHCDNI